MKEGIVRLASTGTVKQTMITVTGTLGSGVLGAVFYIWMARVLGPAEFGIFSVAATTMALVASVSNVGTDTGLIRFVGKYIGKERERALGFLKLGFVVKVAVWLTVGIIGLILARWVAVDVLKKPEITQALKISVVGVGGMLLFSFSVASLQATQRYIVWSGVMISNNLFRLGVVAALVTVSYLSLNRALWIFALVPFFGCLIGLVFIPAFVRAKLGREIRTEFFNYNKWVALFTVLTAISSRVDTFLTVRLLTLKEVGIYAVAVTLAGFVAQITLALATVIAPKLAAFETKEEAIEYIKKLQLFVVILAGLGLAVGVPLGYGIIPVLFGEVYKSGFGVFVILLFAQTMFFMAVPVHMSVMYYFSYPKLFVWVALVYLVIVGGLGWILIANWGMMGAALAVFVAQSVNFVIPAVWVANRLRK